MVVGGRPIDASKFLKHSNPRPIEIDTNQEATVEIYISKENLEPLLVGRNIISETLKVTTPGKLAQMV